MKSLQPECLVAGVLVLPPGLGVLGLFELGAVRPTVLSLSKQIPDRQAHLASVVETVILAASVGNAESARTDPGLERFVGLRETSSGEMQAADLSAESVAEDIGLQDTGPEDTGQMDAVLEDIALEDIALEGTVQAGSALEDTDPEDIALADIGLKDTALEDTAQDAAEPADTVQADTAHRVDPAYTASAALTIAALEPASVVPSSCAAPFRLFSVPLTFSAVHHYFDQKYCPGWRIASSCQSRGLQR
jgi:hypothetical protein